MRLAGTLGVIVLFAAHAAATTATSRQPVPRGARSAPRVTGAPASAVSLVTPLSFEPNLGQAAPEVVYLARQPGATVFLTASAIVLAVRQADEKPRSLDHPFGCTDEPPALLRIVRIRLDGGNPGRLLPGPDTQAGVSNYFIGADPRGWITGVPHESSVLWEQPLPGVNVVFHGDNQQLEFDLQLEARALPRGVSLDIEGADALDVDDAGSLVLHVGTRTLALRQPIAWQDSRRARSPVACAYSIGKDGRVDLQLGVHDPSLPLVIDPVVEFSTYLGGTLDEHAWGIGVDGLGGIHVSGTSASVDFPVLGGFQPAYAGGLRDAVVSRLTPAGGLVYSTYIGGTDDDAGTRLCVDAAGSTIITGGTRSLDFPLAGAVQGAHGGGGTDAFVLQLDPTGSSLAFSTFLGGDGEEWGIGVALDPSGGMVVGGETTGRGFPIVGLPPLGPGGSRDAFVAKLAPGGGSIDWSTWVGGRRDDLGWALALDAAGNAIVAGPSASTDLPMLNPVQAAHAGGMFDIFIARIDAAGSAWLQSTYLGGSGADGTVGGLAVDASGRLIVAGSSDSPDFPLVAPLQPVLGGARDLTLTMFDPSGTSIVRSTYLGGGAYEGPTGLALAEDGSIVMAGGVDGSASLAVDPIQPAYGGGAYDALIVRLDASTWGVTFATPLGGSLDEVANAVALDAAGNIHAAGYTTSTDFPTVNPLQPANAGGSDAFITKITFCGSGGLFDLDQDGLDDRCQAYKNHGDYVSRVAHACRDLGPPSGYASCGDVVRVAARTDIGKR